MDQARQTTGLEDFGEIRFRDGLEALVDAVNARADFHANAIHYLQTKITRILADNLEVTRLIRRRPAIRREAIAAPLIITGLPRTGTTILQTLIALDPESRFLRNWETAVNICPPPRLLRSAADPRIAAFSRTVEGLLQMNPVLEAINGLNFLAGGTAECQNLMAHAFRSMEYCVAFGLRSYGEWLLACDMRPGYQWHRRLLKVLQYDTPNARWVLKAPMHLIALDALLAVYPDARLIFTHRDPFAATLSGASLVYHWSTLAGRPPDRRRIGRWFPGQWARAMRQALAVRRRHRPESFCDIFFDELNADPVGTVRSLYRHWGLTVTPGHRRRMEVWLRDNPRASFGEHAYAAADFGLSREAIDREFAFYKDRFGV
jgi:hypothetical protein